MYVRQSLNYCYYFWVILSTSALLKKRQDEKKSSYDYKNFCAINCSTRRHTLCPDYQHDLHASCTGKKFEVRNYEAIDVRRLLISGHNGLRARIAQRMHVANMVELVWNDVLEQMAVIYLGACTPYANDECTEFHLVVQLEELYHNYAPEKIELTYIAQNRFCRQSGYFPTDFVQETLRTWYFEKDSMPAPVYRQDQSVQRNYGLLFGENNFTHLAYPLTAQLGCGIRNYEKLVCIVCNYYPFHRFTNGTMLFRAGTPTSCCPAVHPLQHELLHELCTGGHSYYGEFDAAQQIHSFFLMVFSLALVQPIHFVYML